MKFTALNTSIVVLAQAHNPTILHPAFLRGQGIVPADWSLAEDPVCTPAISVVKYANKIIFTAELNKFMVLDNAPKENTPIPDLALKYVGKLPHVRYSAVGINFGGYVECETPERWVVDRFVKAGPGNDDKLKPSAVGLKFVYPVERGVLNLNCEIGTFQQPGGQVERPCLVINGNFHIPITEEKAMEETQASIALYPRYLANFRETAQITFGLEN